MSTLDQAVQLFESNDQRRSEAWFRALMEQSPLSTQVFSPDGRTIQVNRAWEELWGGTIEQVADYNILEDPQLEAKGILSYIRRGFAGEALAIPAVWYDPEDTLPGRTRHEDSRRWVSSFIHPIKDRRGQITEVVLMTQDMTDLKRAEMAALASEQNHRLSEERLRLALAAGGMGVWQWNLLTNELWWSDNLEPVHGLEPGSFAGTLEAFQQLIHPDDRPQVNEAIQRAIDERSHFDVEFRNVWPDGSVHWMRGKGSVFCDERGAPVRMMGVGLDITDRRHTEEALRDSEEQFRGIVSGSVAGVAQTDLTGRFVFVNERYCEIVGRTAEELLTLRMQDISHPDELPDNLRLFERLTVNGEPYVIEKRYLRPDGSQVWVNNSVSALRGRNGAVTAVAAVSVDVTARRRAEEALREADRRKTEFLATLAHELRNPLAPVINSLELLRLARDDRESLELARGVMERQLQQMVRLIDDLLDVSRIARGRLELRQTRVELTTIVQHAIETARPAIDAADHELSINLPAEPLYLQADVVRLAQVVANLLTNAAKYTNCGGQISLTAEREGAQAVLCIKDSGIGIAAEQLPRLFQMFSQVDSALERSQGGLGIGLALVRGLVEMHGGTVEAYSEGLGCGSEFRVRLPVLAEALDAAPAAGPLDGMASDVKRRILVVDDNRDSALSMSMALRIAGHETHSAHDGLEALEAAAWFRPEVALLDIGMPRLNGYDVARRIRKEPWGARMTLIAVTGWGQDEDKQRALAAGFDHHLTKPIDHGRLKQLLATPRA